MAEGPEIMGMTDKVAADIARKFGITVEEVWREWEATKAQGAEAVLAEMDERMGEVEQLVQDVADDVSARFLGREDRIQAMGDFYREGWDALSPEEVNQTNVGDLFLNMTVAIYKLAEAQARINALLDGGHRPPKK